VQADGDVEIRMATLARTNRLRETAVHLAHVVGFPGRRS
jgi:hypothetical protein